jgi:nucleoid DNA-binding protein
MTKTELQTALAEATQTDKRTAGVFLDTLSALAYKEIKKNGEFVLPGFGKLVKQNRKARTGFKSKDATEDQDSSQDRRQISCCQSRKGRGFGGKEVVKALPRKTERLV